MNTHRKLNYFSTQNKKSEDFLKIFGMWIVEEISEKSVKSDNLKIWCNEVLAQIGTNIVHFWAMFNGCCLKNCEKINSQKFVTKIF